MKKLVGVLVIVSFILGAKAQNGEIKGKVTDEQTALQIESVIVKVVGKEGASIGKEVKTDKEGNYKISLAAGNYNLEYSHHGYTSQTINYIQVAADKPTFLDVRIAANGEKKDKPKRAK